MVRIHPELSRLLSGMRLCVAGPAVDAAREPVVRSSHLADPRRRAQGGRTSRSSLRASTSTSRLHPGPRAGDQACDRRMHRRLALPRSPQSPRQAQLRSPEPPAGAVSAGNSFHGRGRLCPQGAGLPVLVPRSSSLASVVGTSAQTPPVMRRALSSAPGPCPPRRFAGLSPPATSERGTTEVRALVGTAADR
jgi:hypothetical protein